MHLEPKNKENIMKENKESINLDPIIGGILSIAESLSNIDSTLKDIKADGLKLSSHATDAFTDAIGSGQFNDLFSTLTGRAATSTTDVGDMLSAIRGSENAGESKESAADLINSLNEAKERLSTINSVLGEMKDSEGVEASSEK